jgi:hypothetical protein
MRSLGIKRKVRSTSSQNIESEVSSPTGIGWPCRAGQDHGPVGTFLIKRAFHLDERGNVAVQNPHLRIRWLLAHNGRDHSRYPTDFDMNVESLRTTAKAAVREPYLRRPA